MPDVFDHIRAGCAAVAGNAALVKIDHDRLALCAAELALANDKPPAHDPETHILNQGADTAAFFLILDAINFGSGYFPSLRKRPGRSGYFTIAGGLADWFRRDGPPDPARLVRLDAADCAAVFGQTLSDPVVAALMGWFARALNQLGSLVVDRYRGAWPALIEAADGSAARLVELLRQMPLFEDVSVLDGRTVPFLKRAQLCAADLALAFGGTGWGYFTDLDRLTLFADNLVPHVLRIDGVLRYDPVLAAQIDAGVPIPAQSRAEIELRATAVHAVELLAATLARLGHPTTAANLDFRLWNRGQAPAYKQAAPRHRTQTTNY